MFNARSIWASIMGDPTLMVRFHFWLTIFWLIMVPPSVIFFKESIEYLVYLSVYAAIMGHFSSWQAARVEVKQDEAKERE